MIAAAPGTITYAPGVSGIPAPPLVTGPSITPTGGVVFPGSSPHILGGLSFPFPAPVPPIPMTPSSGLGTAKLSAPTTSSSSSSSGGGGGGGVPNTDASGSPVTPITSLMDILASEYAGGGNLIGQQGSGVVALPTQLTSAPAASAGPSKLGIAIVVVGLALAYWYYKKHKAKAAE